MRARALAALAVGLLLGGLSAPAVDAHTGDQLAQPIFERIKPDAPGVEVEVVYTANFQLVLRNSGDKELTVYADEKDLGDGKGEPYIRIGPEGVFGNFKSPSWYNSNVPEGLLKFPEGSEAGADVPPVWRRVTAEPVWGWFDHRLHPVERYVNQETKQSKKPVKLGEWKVPISIGGDKGAIEGRLEYKPILGTYKSLLKSPEVPADGIKIQLASAPRVPALFVENLSGKPVTILGKDGEPFARIGPEIVEVNLHSPTYVEHIKAQGTTPTVEADARAEPKWEQAQRTPRWRWLEFRAAAPDQEPSEELTERDSPTTVKNWRVPILIGDEKSEIVGITQFVPSARLIKEASAGRTTDEGNSNMPLIAGIAAATLAVGFLVLRPKKKGEPQEARHRSRATPKVKR